MGISIHYSATLKKASDLTELVNEVSDMANELGWDSTIISTPDVSGIVVSPENCEPLLLCFTPDGKTCGIEFLIYGRPTGEHGTMVHTKTQYAGAEIHKALIDVLAYLHNKYFHQIEVYDEAGYWDTGDYKSLFARFEDSQLQSHHLAIDAGALTLSPGEPGWITQALTNYFRKRIGNN